MVRRREAEPPGSGARGDRDAERGRRGRRGARSGDGRQSRHHFHGLAGPAPDDSGPLSHRRGAHALRPARGRARDRNKYPLHLRGTRRCHGLPPDGRRDAGLRQRSGGAGHGRRGARGHAFGTSSLPPFLRRFPHLSRNRQGADAFQRGTQGPHQRPRPCGIPRARPCAGASHRARNGLEPRCVLPEPRGLQRLLQPLCRHRGADFREVRRNDGPPLQTLRVRGPSRGGGRHCLHGLRRGDRWQHRGAPF